MSFDRTTLLRGPGKALFASANLFAEGNITTEFQREREDRGVDAFGVLTRPFGDKRIVTSLQPTQWENLSALFPYATTPVGESIYGATDSPLVLTPVNGAALTVANVACTQMPGIRLAAIGSQFSGDLQLTGLIANSGDPAAAASYYSLAAPATGTALTGLDVAKLLNGSYSASFDGQTLYAEDAFEIGFDLSLDPATVDGHGTVDMFMVSLVATCTFRPVGLTEAQYTALMGYATGIGSEPARHSLTISAEIGKPHVVLNNCEVNPASFVHGSQENRLGQIEFRTARTVTSGALDALFAITTRTA